VNRIFQLCVCGQAKGRSTQEPYLPNHMGQKVTSDSLVAQPRKNRHLRELISAIFQRQKGSTPYILPLVRCHENVTAST
jgi:hypothetical protein